MKKITLRLAYIVLGLLVPAALAGCGGSVAVLLGPDPTPEPTVVPQPFSRDWTLHTLKNDHLALSLPPGWMEFNLSEDDLQTVVGGMMDANPTFGGSMSGQIAGMAAQGIKFYAFDKNSSSIASGFAENLNLVRTEKPTEITLDAALKETMTGLKEQLGGMLDGPLMSTRLSTTSGHELARLNYDAVFNMPDGSPMTLSLVQYIAVTNRDLYVLTGTAQVSRFGDYDQIFEGVAQGMYFIP